MTISGRMGNLLNEYWEWSPNCRAMSSYLEKMKEMFFQKSCLFEFLLCLFASCKETWGPKKPGRSGHSLGCVCSHQSYRQVQPALAFWRDINNTFIVKQKHNRTCTNISVKMSKQMLGLTKKKTNSKNKLLSLANLNPIREYMYLH